MSSTSRLQEQLRSIRASINRFENELACGSDARQRDIDNKFEALTESLNSVSNMVDAEAMRAGQQREDVGLRLKKMIDLSYQDFERQFAELFAKRAAQVERSLLATQNTAEQMRRCQDNKKYAELQGKLTIIKEELAALAQSLQTFASAQDSLEAEVLHRLEQVEFVVDKQISQWIMQTTDIVDTLQRRYNMLFDTAGEGGSEESMDAYNSVLTALREEIITLRSERVEADQEIISTADKYTATLQKSLEAASQYRMLTNEVMRGS